MSHGLVTRRGRPRSVELDYVRDLSEEDISALRASRESGRLARLTNRHHQAARMTAMGATRAEVAFATGYELETLDNLAGDPAFAELVAYYAGQKTAVSVYHGATEKFVALSMAAADEAMRRLTDAPQDYSNKELRETMNSAWQNAREQQAAGGAMPSGAGFNINLSFGQGRNERAGDDGPIVDVTPPKEPPK